MNKKSNVKFYNKSVLQQKSTYYVSADSSATMVVKRGNHIVSALRPFRPQKSRFGPKILGRFGPQVGSALDFRRFSPKLT